LSLSRRYLLAENDAIGRMPGTHHLEE